MEREQRVVGLGGDELLEGGQLHQAHDEADAHAHEEEADHRIEVEQADALVVGGGEPGHEALPLTRVHQETGLCRGRVGAHSPSSDLVLRPRRTSVATKIRAARMMTVAPMVVVFRTYLRPAGS